MNDMSFIEKIHQLWQHAFWADARLLEALRGNEESVPGARREYSHLLAAQEVWLARIERRPPRTAVWPDGSVAETEALCRQTQAAYQAYLANLAEDDLAAEVTYANTAGQRFSNTVSDILLHVALHGHYHRGRVNLLLRQAGCQPAPIDYIAYLRGAPAPDSAQ